MTLRVLHDIVAETCPSAVSGSVVFTFATCPALGDGCVALNFLICLTCQSETVSPETTYFFLSTYKNWVCNS